MPSTKLKPLDFVILALVLCLSLSIFGIGKFSGNGNVLCVTTPDGTTVYNLSENQTISVRSNGYTLTVVIENGAASVTESDCKDRICVHSGRVSKNGESILCAPAGVRISVVKEGSYDFVAG